MLDKVKKEEVLSLFRSNVHRSSSQRAKLSVHCVSRKPRPKLLSSGALGELGTVLKRHGIILPPGWAGESPEARTVPETLQTLKEMVNIDPAAAVIVEEELSALAEKHPLESDRHGILLEGSVAIEDSKKFRESLVVAKGVVPLDDQGYSHISRL